MSSKEEFVIGRHPAREVLQSDRDVNKVFLQDGLSSGKISELFDLAKARGIQVSFVPKSKLDSLSDEGNHQGVVVTASPVDYYSLDELLAEAREDTDEPFFIMLDGVEDPHNLGSIMRTADAAGVNGIIIPNRRAVGLTSTVAKASTGAIEHVPVARVSNLNNTIKKLKDEGFWFFGTDMNGKDYRQWNTQGAIVLVIGNEGEGLSRLVKENMDEVLKIPMTGHVQSLNAGVASAILMYEVYRQRNPLD